MRVIRTLLLLAGAVTLAGAAPNYFPLANGNQWTYRNPASGQSWEIQVGLPIMFGGHAYHKVTGYASVPVFLRLGEDGVLYARDEENERDIRMTTFEPSEQGWYDTPISGCEQGTQARRLGEAVRGHGTYWHQPVRLEYRNYSCADTGLAEELYVENIGLVRRVSSTIAGPQTWELVYARVGALTFSGDPGASFRVTAEDFVDRASADAIPQLAVTMRLSGRAAHPVKLRFPSGQMYDIQLRNADGEVVYKWSDDVAFPQEMQIQMVRELLAGELSWRQTIPLQYRGGPALPDGTYTVEAWLTTDSREFAAAAAFQLRTVE